MLTRGTYVIMNDVDCPEARLVAVLTRFDDAKGIWHALYLATYTNMAAPYGPDPTPLSDFGMTVERRWNVYRVIANGKPSIATYRDGHPRNWQDRFGEDRWWEMRKQAVKAWRHRAAQRRPDHDHPSRNA